MTTALKTPINTQTGETGLALVEYVGSFPVRITVKAGPVYTIQFKEFHDWCNASLGKKYKDWFMLSHDKNTYTLYLKSTKWSTFLALKFSDIIDIS